MNLHHSRYRCYMIDLAAVESLIAIERTGTVHRASKELGFTPSAVSQQVKRLERDLGTALLERAGRGVVLTAAGRRLADEGRELRDRVESLRSRLHAVDAAPTGTLRLGVFSTALRGIVAPVIGEVRAQAPDLRLVVRELEPPEAVDAVAAGTLDVAVVHGWEGVGLTVPPALRSEELLHDVADVLVPARSPLAARAALTPHDLADEPWVCTPEGTVCYEWFCHMYADAPRAPRIDCWIDDFASHAALVAEGVVVALVPRLGRGVLPDGVVAVPLRDPVPTRSVAVVWRATMTESPAVRFVRARLAAAAPVD